MDSKRRAWHLGDATPHWLMEAGLHRVPRRSSAPRHSSSARPRLPARLRRVRELRRQVSRLERALGRKTMEAEIAGELLRGWE
jgi:hypothetical protein